MVKAPDAGKYCSKCSSILNEFEVFNKFARKYAEKWTETFPYPTYTCVIVKLMRIIMIFQPSLLEQTWSNPKIWFKHMPAVLQRICQRYWIQEGKTNGEHNLKT